MLIEQFVASGQARYEFRYMPVLGDPAVYAAVAVACANEQGGFWPLHDRFMLADETLFSEAGLRRQVEFDGLDYDIFQQCMLDAATLPLIQASYGEGVERGVVGTPTIFVNGVRVDHSYDAIADAVERALNTP